ncbi:MAG TPA: NAD(P)/FAD-dependent oxidoreductase [Flavisolibacter sp.]|nr:NAD(P)/FAD-dependent oxidoreductase [Flavisolibacter sp.]
MNRTEFDVVIVGAGAAGLIAALEIALTGRSVAIIEAKDRVGGRILTSAGGLYPIELGAEFVHGNLPQTKQYLEKAGAETYTVNGNIWQHKDGSLQQQEDFIADYKTLEKKCKDLVGDKPVETFLEEDLSGEEKNELRFTLRNYVKGYYAADVRNASTKALCIELTKGDDEQFRVRQGYGVMVNYLENACREKGVQFFLSQPVLQVQWKKGHTAIITEKQTFRAAKLLLTVPVGVLQKEAITFFPALPEINRAVQKLGFGYVVKIVLRFENAFWKEKTNTQGKDLSSMSFLFSQEEVPTWWTHYPEERPLLTGWLAGPRAATAQFMRKEEIVQKALLSLQTILGMDILRLHQMLDEAYYYNWSADPFVCGAYSYETVGGEEAITTVQKGVEDTLFFAGEGLRTGPEIGTVEAALASGRETAHQLIASF